MQNITDISIHALLAESDAVFCVHNRAFDDFYPRSPCGERLAAFVAAVIKQDISIHALLAESDSTRSRAGAAVY